MMDKASFTVNGTCEILDLHSPKVAQSFAKLTRHLGVLRSLPGHTSDGETRSCE